MEVHFLLSVGVTSRHALQLHARAVRSHRRMPSPALLSVTKQMLRFGPVWRLEHISPVRRRALCFGCDNAKMHGVLRPTT